MILETVQHFNNFSPEHLVRNGQNKPINKQKRETFEVQELSESHQQHDSFVSWSSHCNQDLKRFSRQRKARMLCLQGSRVVLSVGTSDPFNQQHVLVWPLTETLHQYHPLQKQLAHLFILSWFSLCELGDVETRFHHKEQFINTSVFVTFNRILEIFRTYYIIQVLSRKCFASKYSQSAR